MHLLLFSQGLKCQVLLFVLEKVVVQDPGSTLTSGKSIAGSLLCKPVYKHARLIREADLNQK